MTEERKQQIANEVAEKMFAWVDGITAMVAKKRVTAAILEAITIYEKEGWVSVTEKMPELYSSVLLAHNDTADGSQTVEEAQWNDGYFTLIRTDSSDNNIDIGPNHARAWRPLPSPPETH